MKLAFMSPLENYFTLDFVCSHHNIKFAQTLPSQGTNSHFGRVESLSPAREASIGFDPMTFRSVVERDTPRPVRLDKLLLDQIHVPTAYQTKRIPTHTIALQVSQLCVSLSISVCIC